MTRNAFLGLAAASFLALGATSCGPPTEIDGPFVFAYQTSGGLADIYYRIDIDSAAKTITLAEVFGKPGQTAAVSDDEIESVATALEKANFMHLSDGPDCDGCTDNTYSWLSLDVDGEEHQVEWFNAYGPVEGIVSTVEDLSKSKFGVPQ